MLIPEYIHCGTQGIAKLIRGASNRDHEYRVYKRLSMRREQGDCFVSVQMKLGCLKYTNFNAQNY